MLHIIQVLSMNNFSLNILLVVHVLTRSSLITRCMLTIKINIHDIKGTRHAINNTTWFMREIKLGMLSFPFNLSVSKLVSGFGTTLTGTLGIDLLDIESLLTLLLGP